MPRFNAVDQFGENVDLYDFANQGKMILIELSATWCSPCNDLASWLATNDQKIRGNRWWNDRYLPIRDMIENNEIFLVNFLFEGTERKTTATHDDVVAWYNNYPDPNVPVLTDDNRYLHSWIKPTGLPCIFLVDENMRLINYTNRGLTDAFLYLTQP
jgi:thiol-disulfide isomerase/thioredoxin